MKKLSLFILALTSFLFSSCGDNEPLDDVLAGQVSSGSSGNGGTSTGDYWPATVGNWWQYSQNGVTQDPVEVIGTDTFNSATYYELGSQSGNGNIFSGDTSMWLNKNGGFYNIKIGDISFSGGGISGTVTGYELIVLKDNIATGESWTGSFTQSYTYTGLPSTTQTTNYTGTILEKDVTVTVDGETYTNVIKSQVTMSVDFSGTTTTTSTEYWFALDIGPVKTISVAQGSTTESILTSYAIQ